MARKLVRAKSRSHACRIGYEKARDAGRPGVGARACSAEIAIWRRGGKSPRKLVLAKK